MADLPAAPAVRPARAVLVTVLAAVALTAAVIAGIGLGARDISVPDIVRILLNPGEDSYNAHVLWTERIPRTFLGLAVGAALGCSGLIMQALTMNPLADPGILGVEQGAALFVVLGILYLDASGVQTYVWLALVGASLAAALVYTIGVRANLGSSTIARVLAGVAVAAMASAVMTLLVVRDEEVFAHLRFWSVGQLTGRAKVFGEALPFMLVGLLLALPLGRALNILGLGEEAATGLGVKVGRTRLYSAAVGVLLCAAATAAVGPVAFVGLVGAHSARLLIGADHRWSLPLSMACGAILLLTADIIGRLAPGDGEIQVGVMTAVIGTPFFVWLARRRNLVRV